MRLVLIRHGQTDANIAGALDTAVPGLPLNATGIMQARRLAEKWEQLVGQEPVRVVSSSILRAQQTAAPLAQTFGLRPEPDNDLREVGAGSVEMSTDTDDINHYLGLIIAWAGGQKLDERIGGAENGREVLQRFDRGISRATLGVGSLDTVAVVVHGAIMRTWVGQRTEQASADLLGQFPCPNTGFAVLEGSGQGGWQCQIWADKPVSDWPVTPGGQAKTSNTLLDVD